MVQSIVLPPVNIYCLVIKCLHNTSLHCMLSDDLPKCLVYTVLFILFGQCGTPNDGDEKPETG